MAMTQPFADRLFYLASGALLMIGGVLFVWGGSQHPPTGTNLGAIGSEEFFLNFARHIVQHPAWERIHIAILVGPLCWAVGGIGLCLALRDLGESRFGTLGAATLAMGATAWAVTFVFDGFVALRIAQAMLASRPNDMPSIATAFHANQVVVIRLGLVSLVLIGWGMAALGGSILASTMGSRTLRWLLGASGLLLGAWPTIAWAAGVFEPGPFVSRLWVPTALLTAAWFVSAGVVTIAHAARAGRNVKG
jgi:hypothetical protein